MSPESQTLPDRVIGHRGACGHSPENTLAGIAKAAEFGARWVEFDVKLTADGVAVLLHDETLDRTTNRKGLLAGTSFEVVARLDAGSWFGAEFAGERVPSLAETVAALAWHRLGAIVEIKACPGREEATATEVARVLERANVPLVVSSFSEASLRVMHERLEGVSRALLFREVPADWRDRAATVGARALHVLESALDRELVRLIKGFGYDLRAFTVDDPRRAHELYAFGVDGVFTGYPERLLAERPRAR